MADEIVRTFFAFKMPRSVTATAENLGTLIDDPKGVVRWLKGYNIHLTLRFLGATPKPVVEEIAAALEPILSAIPSFKIDIEGTGVFPGATRPRTIWLGVNGDIDPLIQIEEEIHQVVEPLGFPREDRDFKPHVTIARIKYPQKVTPVVSTFLSADYEPVICHLWELHLYESRTEGGGVSYHPLHTFSLTNKGQELK